MKSSAIFTASQFHEQIDALKLLHAEIKAAQVKQADEKKAEHQQRAMQKLDELIQEIEQAQLELHQIIISIGPGLEENIAITKALLKVRSYKAELEAFFNYKEFIFIKVVEEDKGLQEAEKKQNTANKAKNEAIEKAGKKALEILKVLNHAYIKLKNPLQATIKALPTEEEKAAWAEEEKTLNRQGADEEEALREKKAQALKEQKQFEMQYAAVRDFEAQLGNISDNQKVFALRIKAIKDELARINQEALNALQSHQRTRSGVEEKELPAGVELQRMRSGIEVKDEINPDEIQLTEDKLREYLKYYELQSELMALTPQSSEADAEAYNKKRQAFQEFQLQMEFAGARLTSDDFSDVPAQLCWMRAGELAIEQAAKESVQKELDDLPKTKRQASHKVPVVEVLGVLQGYIDKINLENAFLQKVRDHFKNVTRYEEKKQAYDEKVRSIEAQTKTFRRQLESEIAKLEIESKAEEKKESDSVKDATKELKAIIDEEKANLSKAFSAIGDANMAIKQADAKSEELQKELNVLEEQFRKAKEDGDDNITELAQKIKEQKEKLVKQLDEVPKFQIKKLTAVITEFTLRIKPELGSTR